jgi:hypothetical protein
LLCWMPEGERLGERALLHAMQTVPSRMRGDNDSAAPRTKVHQSWRLREMPLGVEDRAIAYLEAQRHAFRR